MKFYMFRTVPLSIIRSFSQCTQQWYTSYQFGDSLQAGSGCSILILFASCQQTSMTYIIVVCTVKNSWWWREELSQTCRVSFQKKKKREISASSWFYYTKFITMHGHMNVKFHTNPLIGGQARSFAYLHTFNSSALYQTV